MRFESAWPWLLVPPLIVWVWWLARRSYAQHRPGWRRASAGLRLLILICLVAAVSRPVWFHAGRGQHLLFLIDVSRSVSRENLEGAMADTDRLAREALQRGPHRLSVVAFGRDPRVLANSQGAWKGWDDAQRNLLLH